MTPKRSWLKDPGMVAPRHMRRLLWIGLELLFLGLFIKLTWELHEGSGLDSLDHKILIFISGLRIAALNGPATDISALGSRTLITIFTVIGGILLWLNRDRWGCAYLAAGSTGAGIATVLLKHFFRRARPSGITPLVEVHGFSYPSGHSLTATSFYLLLMFIAWRHYTSWKSRGTLLACTAVLVGTICFSRLYLGVHYPSDVLSGIFLGSAWVFLLTFGLSEIENRNGK